MNKRAHIPIDTVDLLPVLDGHFMDLIRSLTPDEWQRQTVAKLWTVKEVVAHLLDGNIRILSMLRDEYSGAREEINGYDDLVSYLNRLNAEWVQAMKRVSPAMLIRLHEATGKMYCEYYASLDPFGKAGFAVNWAGEDESRNWMHIAREYTEKWLHQQQIREAVNKPGLMEPEFFHPLMNTFMMALPYTFRNVQADKGTAIGISIAGYDSLQWTLTREENQWSLQQAKAERADATVTIEAAAAWKLFSKSLRPTEIMDKVQLTGNQQLGARVLDMISVMA